MQHSFVSQKDSQRVTLHSTNVLADLGVLNQQKKPARLNLCSSWYDALVGTVL